MNDFPANLLAVAQGREQESHGQRKSGLKPAHRDTERKSVLVFIKHLEWTLGSFDKPTKIVSYNRFRISILDFFSLFPYLPCQQQFRTIMVIGHRVRHTEHHRNSPAHRRIFAKGKQILGIGSQTT